MKIFKILFTTCVIVLSLGYFGFWIPQIVQAAGVPGRCIPSCVNGKVCDLEGIPHCKVPGCFSNAECGLGSFCDSHGISPALIGGGVCTPIPSTGGGTGGGAGTCTASGGPPGPEYICTDDTGHSVGCVNGCNADCTCASGGNGNSCDAPNINCGSFGNSACCPNLSSFGEPSCTTDSNGNAACGGVKCNHDYYGFGSGFANVSFPAPDGSGACQDGTLDSFGVILDTTNNTWNWRCNGNPVPLVCSVGFDPGFTLAVTPPTETVSANSTYSYTITITPTNAIAYGQYLLLDAQGAPAPGTFVGITPTPECANGRMFGANEFYVSGVCQFTYSGPSSSLAGNYNIIFSAVPSNSNIQNPGRSVTVGLTVAVAPDASCLSMTGVPATINPGGTINATIVMQNTGTVTWTQAASYALTDLPWAGPPWGQSFNIIPTPTVAPNATATFFVSVTAPAALGSYNFDWQMNHVAWFGQICHQVVTVAPTPPTLTFTFPASAQINTPFAVSWSSTNATAVVLGSSIMPPAGCSFSPVLAASELSGSRNVTCSTLGNKFFQLTVANSVNVQVTQNGNVNITAPPPPASPSGGSSCNSQSSCPGSGGNPPGGGGAYAGGGTPVCSIVRLEWTDNSTDEDGFKLYRNSVNNPGSASLIATVNTASKAATGQVYGYDSSPPDTNSYFYWVTAFNAAAGQSAPFTAFSPASISSYACQAQMINSDKEITKVNNAPVTPAPVSCNGASTPLPIFITPKTGDTLTFSVNLCNNTIGSSATSTSLYLTDTLTDLSAPTGGAPGNPFNARYKGLGLSYDNSSCTPLPVAGHYCVSGTAPLQQIVFNLKNDALYSIPAGQAFSLTFDAQLAVPANFSGTAPRFQNSVHLDYNNGIGPAALDFFTPLQLFVNGNGIPVIQERP